MLIANSSVRASAHISIYLCVIRSCCCPAYSLPLEVITKYYITSFVFALTSKARLQPTSGLGMYLLPVVGSGRESMV